MPGANIQACWHIKNFGMFRTLAHSEPNVFTETCQTSTMERFAKIVKVDNYFRNISCSRSLLDEIKYPDFFLMYV